MLQSPADMATTTVPQYRIPGTSHKPAQVIALLLFLGLLGFGTFILVLPAM